METNTLTKKVFTAAAFCAMVYLFFMQARIAMQPVGLQFERPPIAYGYNNVTLSGYVYKNEGITAVSAGSGVALNINGGVQDTTTTDANGYYEFTDKTIEVDDVLAIYVNNESLDGVLIAKFDVDTLGGSMSGMNIYGDRLIIRSSGSNLPMNTANLQVADDTPDADITAVYAMDGNHLKLGNNKELYIWEDSILRSSGSIFTHDIDIRGTMQIGGNNVTASGSFASSGSLVMTGSVTMTSRATSEEISLYGSAFNGDLNINNGLLEYWKFDEGTGTNASGSSIVGTGGSLVNMASPWVQTNSGTTKFYNWYALEFDGTDDHIDFGDKFDVQTGAKRTFAGWFRRKSSTTEDVIFAKRTGSGATSSGYMLFIDDEDDKLYFEVSDTSDEYSMASTTTFTDQNWHHYAVTWDTLTESGAQMYIDGTNNTPARSGTFANIGSINNIHSFFIGEHSASGSTFTGTMDDMRIYNRVLTGSEVASLANGKKSTGSGVFILKHILDVNGDMNILSGTVDVSADNHQATFAGDLNVQGELLTQSGTVTLDGGNQTLRGSTAFRHLVKSTTTSKTLTLESNAQQTASGSLTLNGAVNNLLSLRATITGSDTYIRLEDPGGGETLQFLNVKDNNAQSGATLTCLQGCVDSGNNTNWEFIGVCGDGIENTGEECDDANSSNTDSCLNTCVRATCGDSFVNVGIETCDPPDGANCQDNCQLRGGGGGGLGRLRSSAASNASSFFQRPPPPDGCGNKILEPEKGEECDTGERFNGLGVCSYDCKLLYCGDGVVSPEINEDCEPEKDGETYIVATCGETCTAPRQTGTRTTRHIDGCQKLLLAPCSTSSASSASVSKEVNVCGNGIKETAEECDYGGKCVGGQFDGSFWTDQKSAQTCIDTGGTPSPQSGDGCSNACTLEFCGDGIVQKKGTDNKSGTTDDEECDNGSVCSQNANLSCAKDAVCSPNGTCTYNVAKDRSCSSKCKRLQSAAQSLKPASGTITKSSSSAPDTKLPLAPFCGNAIIEAGEECDEGEFNSNVRPDSCRLHCVMPSCGDFVVDSNESCDNGDANSDSKPNSCRLNCQMYWCGDGVRDSTEQCDGTPSCSDRCMLLQTIGRCGNRSLERGEQCDDGNIRSGDGCSRFCQIEAPSLGAAEQSEPEDAQELIDHEVSKELLVLDADVVIVNPVELANALKFIDQSDSCSQLVLKGQGKSAKEIRDAANRQHIPIVANIPVARSLYNEHDIGSVINGELCDEINDIKRELGIMAPTEVSEENAAIADYIAQPEVTPFPVEPSQNGYGFYNYAQLAPYVAGNPPAGETGPGLIIVITSGAAAGVGLMRRRRRK